MNNEALLLKFKDMVSDIHEMHDKYDFHQWMKDKKEDRETLIKYLKFRFDFLQEEIDEGKLAIDGKDAEEVVDALIDLIVVAIGTLDIFDIDTRKAWDAVHAANMAKERGMKETRKNEYGAPDLVKPEGWTAPSHEGNHGIIGEIFE